jgi:AraC family transcriptional regulator of adaptative response/methylated-DNA-[protein]-cysteine methyltransferase
MYEQRILPPISEMNRAFQTRDSSYDGIFFTAVRSTGIFCRPSCPARRPREENIVYYGTVKEAMFAGYRPCLRCRPMETDGAPPDWLNAVLKRAGEAGGDRIRDEEIRLLGVDPARVRRYFKKQYGMTFQAYCRAQRLGKALEDIRLGSGLLEAGWDHGYESSSGFRQAFSEVFGKSPGKCRDADCILAAWVETPCGPMVAAATSAAVCLLEFTDRRMLEQQFRTLRKLFSAAVVPGDNTHLIALRRQLEEYFGGRRETFDLPLDFRGTEFQMNVWRELLKIPYGQTRSYEDIARMLRSPGAVRAVGHANGQNRIAIVIPCHRVVNKDGKLGGYGGGLWRKRLLLDLEGRQQRL